MKNLETLSSFKLSEQEKRRTQGGIDGSYREFASFDTGPGLSYSGYEEKTGEGSMDWHKTDTCLELQ